MNNKKININYKNLDIVIYIKSVKNISMKISSGEIFVNIPKRKEKKAIELTKNFVDEKYDWIIKNVLKTKEMEEKYKIENIKFNKMDKLKFLGNIYDVIYIENGDILIDEDSRIIYINKEKLDLEKIKKKINKKFKEKLRQISLRLIKKWEIILSIKINNLKITSGKGNWGSCNTKKGYINLNKNLIYKEISQIEYVVLHELSHLFYPNHGKDFKDMMSKYMPDWKERKKNLNKKI